MFGFDDIAGFTHNLESAFDRLRNGQLAATSDLINLTLAAGDQIRAMLDESAGHGTVDQSRSAGILSELRAADRSAGIPDAQNVPASPAAPQPHRRPDPLT